MIRIRKANGDSIDIPDARHFVELVNDVDGTVGTVLMQMTPGTIVKISPGSEDARRYEQMFGAVGVKFCPTMIQRSL